MTAPAALGPEAALLVACARSRVDGETTARVRALIEAGVDWPAVVARASPHGMLPLLALHVAALGHAGVPEEVRADLRERFERNGRQNLGLAGELVRLTRALDAAGIPAVAFKGPTLALTAYGNLALRQFLDLDILVERRQLAPASRVLAAEGYASASPGALTAPQHAVFLRFAPTLTLTGAAGRVVDLHGEVQSRLLAVPFDTAGLLARACRLPLAGGAVPTLSPEDLLLVLCVHGSKHRWERLAWICDVAELVNRHPRLDWDRVLESAAALRIRRLLDLGLRLAGEPARGRDPRPAGAARDRGRKGPGAGRRDLPPPGRAPPAPRQARGGHVLDRRPRAAARPEPLPPPRRDGADDPRGGRGDPARVPGVPLLRAPAHPARDPVRPDPAGAGPPVRWAMMAA